MFDNLVETIEEGAFNELPSLTVLYGSQFDELCDRLSDV